MVWASAWHHSHKRRCWNDVIAQALCELGWVERRENIYIYGGGIDIMCCRYGGGDITAVGVYGALPCGRNFAWQQAGKALRNMYTWRAVSRRAGETKTFL